MKYLLNALILRRTVLCISLLFLRLFPAWFSVLYTIYGVSNMLDEYLARGPSCTGPAGARLDNAAGFTLVAVLLFQLVPTANLPVWLSWWIVGIMFIKFSSLATGYVRHKQATFLHTYANKAAGLLLLCLPYGFPLWGFLVGAAVCLFATLAAVEELILHLTFPVLNQDVKGLLLR